MAFISRLRKRVSVVEIMEGVELPKDLFGERVWMAGG